MLSNAVHKVPLTPTCTTISLLFILETWLLMILTCLLLLNLLLSTLILQNVQSSTFPPLTEDSQNVLNCTSWRIPACGSVVECQAAMLSNAVQKVHGSNPTLTKHIVCHGTKSNAIVFAMQLYLCYYYYYDCVCCTLHCHRNFNT